MIKIQILLILIFVVTYSKINSQNIIHNDIHFINYRIFWNIEKSDYISKIKIKLVDSLNNKSYQKNLDNFDYLVIDNLDAFNISSIENQLIFEYEDVVAREISRTYHIFEIRNDSLFFQKKYSYKSNRQGYTFGGSLIDDVIKFNQYEPGKVNNSKYTEIESFYGFQEMKDPKPFLPLFEKKVEVFCKKNQRDSIQLYCNPFVINFLFKDLFKIAKNQVLLNNVGYYLERGGFYNEAIYILEEVVRNYPNRTVAYLNLGDAYWNKGEKEKAKEAYRQYILLLKKDGKQNKIPDTVKEKLGNDTVNAILGSTSPTAIKPQTDSLKPKVAEGKLLDCYYTNLNGDKIEKVYKGQSVFMVIYSVNMIGKTLNIDISDEDIIYEFNGKEIENQTIENFPVVADKMMLKLTALRKVND